MDLAAVIALSMGAAWASGINLYAAVFVLGFMGATGHVNLPPHLEVLSDPLVLVAAGFMYCVEFFADKVPGVDTGWDAVHTFVRIPAGAVLAAGALGEVSLAAQVAAGLVGGTLAACAHATKSGARVLINTSPEPVTNWVTSLAEDVAVVAGLWTALEYPVVFIGILVVVVAAMLWLLPRLWRGIQRVIATITGYFRGERVPTAAVPPAPPGPAPVPGIAPPRPDPPA